MIYCIACDSDDVVPTHRKNAYIYVKGEKVLGAEFRCKKCYCTWTEEPIESVPKVPSGSGPHRPAYSRPEHH
jgi:hypothetical protein